MTASERYRAFHAACWENESLARQMVSDDPTLLDVRSGLGETVLHDSAIENNPEVVRLLLSLGANPNPLNRFGKSAIQECAAICSAEHDLCEVLKLLLCAGADPYHHHEYPPCAWHTAVCSNFARLKQLFDPIPCPLEFHAECELGMGSQGRFEGNGDEPS